MQLEAHLRVEGPDRPEQLDLVRDDVGSHTAVNGAERHHAGDPRVHLAGRDRVECGNHPSRDRDGIHAAPRIGRVGLAALDQDRQAVRARHRPLLRVADRPDLVAVRHVQAEHHLRHRIVEGALGEHQVGTAFLLPWRSLFGGLEHEDDAARQALAHSSQQLRHAHQDRGVRIVPAGVHHADLAAPVRGARHRGEGKARRLGDGQGVHVGAQRHHRSVLRSAQHSDHAGVGHVPTHLETERLEVIAHQRAGADLAVRELRVLVDVAAPADHALLECRRTSVDLRGEVSARGGRGAEGQQRTEHSKSTFVFHGSPGGAGLGSEVARCAVSSYIVGDEAGLGEEAAKRGGECWSSPRSVGMPRSRCSST